MSNPVHPKVLGGFAGTAAGAALGGAIDGVLEKIPAFAHQATDVKQYVTYGILGVLAASGQFIVSYLSKWEPAVGKVVQDDLDQLFTEAPKADDDAPVVLAEAPKAVDPA